MKKVVVSIIAAIVLISALSVVTFADNENDVFGVNDQDATPINWDEATGNYIASDTVYILSGNFLPIFIISIIVIIAGAIIVFFVLKNKKKQSVRPQPRRSRHGDRSTSVTEMRPIEEYRDIDPAFDEKELEDKAASLFLRLQECRMKRDVSALRPLLSDDVYAHYEHEIKSMMMQGQSVVIEKPHVDKVTVRGYKRGKFHDHMKLKLEVRLIEYTISDRSRHRRSGSRDKILTKKYEWDMRRRRSDVTFNDKAGDEPNADEWKLDSIKALLNRES